MHAAISALHVCENSEVRLLNKVEEEDIDKDEEGVVPEGSDKGASANVSPKNVLHACMAARSTDDEERTMRIPQCNSETA